MVQWKTISSGGDQFGGISGAYKLLLERKMPGQICPIFIKDMRVDDIYEGMSLKAWVSLLSNLMKGSLQLPKTMMPQFGGTLKMSLEYGADITYLVLLLLLS